MLRGPSWLGPGCVWRGTEEGSVIWSRGRSPEFGGIESPRIWGPIRVPERVWQAPARGHDPARPPGALPNLLCAEGPGFGTRRRTRSPGRRRGGGRFRALFTLGLPGELGGHGRVKPISGDCRFPASVPGRPSGVLSGGAVGGGHCWSPHLQIGKLRQRAQALTRLSSCSGREGA